MPVGKRARTEIGIFEAKTKLSEILRKVDQGERFTITVRGRAVADVVPAQRSTTVRSPEEIEAAYQRLRNPSIRGISHEEIRSAIEAGRP
jgi:prevent-host-death family protein